MHETHRRSILKGITWRFVASVTTMAIVFFATGDLILVASVGAADVVVKILFYYLHERFWGSVRWGIVGTEPGTRTSA